MTKQEAMNWCQDFKDNVVLVTKEWELRHSGALEVMDIAIECIEKQTSMARKLSEIEEVIYDYCDTMAYKIIIEKIADILGVELIQIGLEG